MSAWRLALRLARRDTRRHRVRSLLVLLLLAAPVAGATVADIYYRTHWAALRSPERDFGGADAVTGTGSAAGVASLDGKFRGPAPTSAATVRGVLPPGARIVAASQPWALRLAPGDAPTRRVDTEVVATELGDPLVQDLARLVSGRVPGPGEVALSRPLARDLGLLDGGRLRAGASVVAAHAVPAPVTGLVVRPPCLSCGFAVVRPGEPLFADAPPARSGRTPAHAVFYRVDLPDGTDEAALATELRSSGLTVEFRAGWDRNPAFLLDRLDRLYDGEKRAVALVALLAGLGLGQIVLLGATAFAIGARRQARDLAIVAVQGARPRDLRRIVLAEGLLLGCGGAALGVALGVAGAWAARGGWERSSNASLPLALGPYEIAAAALVGIASGLAAALVPARTAGRRNVLAAMGPPARCRPGARLAAAAALTGAGVVLAVVGGRGLERGIDGRGARFDGARVGANITDDTDQVLHVLPILVGAGAVVGALLLAVPVLMDVLARSGHAAGRPSSLRFAARDAGRNRHRSAPATCAIAVATAGAAALVVLAATEDRAAYLRDVPGVPDGTVLVAAGAAKAPTASERAAVAALADALRVRQEISVDALDLAIGGYDRTVLSAPGIARPGLAELVAASPADAAAMRDALTAGRAVVFGTGALDEQGRITLLTDPARIARGGETKLPATLVRRAAAFAYLPDSYVGVEHAERAGWPRRHQGTLVVHEPAPAAAVRAAAAAAPPGPALLAPPGVLPRHGIDENHYIAPELRPWAVGAAALAVVGVAAPLALAAREARPDLATVSAVGAGPRRRRQFAATETGLLAALGTVAGLALGIGFAVAARPATGSPEAVVPWPELGALVAGVLVLALAVGFAAGAEPRTPGARPVLRRPPR